jgi:hypothetical protein
MNRFYTQLLLFGSLILNVLLLLSLAAFLQTQTNQTNQPKPNSTPSTCKGVPNETIPQPTLPNPQRRNSAA